jgi:hypothetical protein
MSMLSSELTGGVDMETFLRNAALREVKRYGQTRTQQAWALR